MTVRRSKHNAVVVEGLSAGYGRSEVLRSVDLAVPRGSITAVLGPSGSGKSTLLRAIAGLEKARAGRIVIDDAVMADTGIDVAPERRRVGLVPQEGALFDHLSVAANIGFGLGPRWRRAPGRAARIAELLDEVGLAGFAHRKPAQLSGGQQQRVALARALAPRPAVIALDEPFSALDAALRSRLREHVRTTLRAEGATALLVTHDADEALAMADAVTVLVDGLVRQSGPVQQVYAEPVDYEVARLFGEVTAIEATGHGAVAESAIGTVPLRSAQHGSLSLLVRPSDLSVTTGGPHVVHSSRFRGERCALVVTVGDLQLRLDVPAEGAPVEGASVTVVAAGDVHAVAGEHRLSPTGDLSVT